MKKYAKGVGGFSQKKVWKGLEDSHIKYEKIWKRLEDSHIKYEKIFKGFEDSHIQKYKKRLEDSHKVYRMFLTIITSMSSLLFSELSDFYNTVL